MRWFLIFLLSGCSSYGLKKSLTYSCATGFLTGGSAGYMLAPEPRQNKFYNAGIFGGIGCLLTGGLAYIFHKNNPLKNPLPKRIERERPEFELDLGASKVFIRPQFIPIKSYKRPVEELPESLQKIFPYPYIEVHKLEDQLIKSGGESIYLRNCEAIIQTIEEPNLEVSGDKNEE